MKKIIWIWTFMVIMTVASMNVYAAESEQKYIDGDFTYKIVDGKAMLMDYTGEEKEVYIPETVGNDIPVTILHGLLFGFNDKIEKIFISKNVEQVKHKGFSWITDGIYHEELDVYTFNGLTSLQEINVDPANKTFYSEDGVLYAYDIETYPGKALLCYPQAKRNEKYNIPSDICFITTSTFNRNPFLKTVIIPESVQTFGINTFVNMQGTKIVLNHLDAESFEFSELGESNFDTSCKELEFIVKNEEVKKKVAYHARVTGKDHSNIVKCVAELTEDELKEYVVPATNLTFSDGTKDKEIIISKDETGGLKALLEDNDDPRRRTDLYLFDITEGSMDEISCTIYPQDTTEVLTWTSDNINVARVGYANTSKHPTVYGIEAGTCIITGQDESGHKLILRVTVRSKVNEKEKETESSSDKETKTDVKSKQKISGTASVYKKPYKSSFTLKAKAKTSCSYKSSNKRIVTVNSKGRVTVKGVGKATITVTAKETAKYKKAIKKITIYAVPVKIKTASVKGTRRKAVLSWKKDSKADGYYIQYSMNKKFKGSKKVYCSKKSVKKTIGNLKKGKRYYFRICAYKKIDGRKYCGSYSKIIKCKIK